MSSFQPRSGVDCVGSEGDERQTYGVVHFAYGEVFEAVAHVSDFFNLGACDYYFAGGSCYRRRCRVEDAVVAGGFESFKVASGREAALRIVDCEVCFVAFGAHAAESRVLCGHTLDAVCAFGCKISQALANLTFLARVNVLEFVWID